MKYKEIVLRTTLEKLDALILQLGDRGIADLILSDPRDLPDLIAQKDTCHWDYIDDSVLSQLSAEPSVTFYLEAGADAVKLLEGLDIRQIEARDVDDQDWLHRWKDYFKPALITERFVVKPDWCDYQPAPGEQVIEMDPGMAFGTGTHATTRLCLRLLEKYIKPGDALLDVGTGTGILSIAAAMLGSGEVLAVDIDPQAVQTAGENVIKNRVDPIVRVALADLTEGIDFQANVIVSNLMADLIIRFAGSIKEHLKEEGVYIAGGIIQGKEDTVRTSLESRGFRVVETLQEGEWWAIAAKRA